ncbi:hypothetical protein [Streptomyces sp. NPDC003299]
MAGRKRGGADSRCPSCGAPLLVQWVGDTAALQARVDLPPAEEPRPYGSALAASTPDDLVWCLPRQPHRAPRLRWTSRGHPPDCPHQHLTSHKCPPTTLF